MDISPNYSGTILGLATGFAYLAGVVNSALLGNFISGNVSTHLSLGENNLYRRLMLIDYFQGTLSQWRSLFLIIASTLVFGAGFFGYFGDCEVEHWN